ncbi:MAG: hypothetical protein IKK41_06055 [Oscillospiraceae bacterium]|nr:hypothetical protein [Oscillospiraceae bacterium]
MSYRIEYNPEKNRQYPMQAARKPKWLIAALVVIVVLFMFQKIDRNHILRSWLLPGDSDVTVSAFSSMVDGIRAGEPVKDAVTAFCLEIIHNE